MLARLSCETTRRPETWRYIVVGAYRKLDGGYL